MTGTGYGLHVQVCNERQHQAGRFERIHRKHEEPGRALLWSTVLQRFAAGLATVQDSLEVSTLVTFTKGVLMDAQLQVTGVPGTNHLHTKVGLIMPHISSDLHRQRLCCMSAVSSPQCCQSQRLS